MFDEAGKLKRDPGGCLSVACGAYLFIAVFAGLIFLDISLERMLARGLFAAATAFLCYCELRRHIGRKGAALAWYDWPVIAAFFSILSVTMMVAVAASAGYPFLLIGLAAIVAFVWRLGRPRLRSAHHAFRFFWLPPALYCCLCMWWMNYMQNIVPECNQITFDPCPAYSWVNPVDIRYKIVAPKGSDAAVVVYLKKNYWEVYPLDDFKRPIKVRKPGLTGRIAENVRDRKLYFLAVPEIPPEKYHMRALLRVVDVENDFKIERTIDMEKISPFSKSSRLGSIYYLEKTGEIFIAGIGNEIKIWKEPGFRPVKFFEIPNLNPVARYVVKDNIYAILVADDRKIYTAEWTGFVSVIDPDLGRAVKMKFLYGPVSALYMSPDGDTLFALTVTGYLYFLSPSDLSVKKKVRVEFGVRQLQPAPDLRALFVGNYLTGNVFLVEMDTGEVKKLFNAGEKIEGLAYQSEKKRILASSACGVFIHEAEPGGLKGGDACPGHADIVKKGVAAVDRFPDYMFPALNPSFAAFKEYAVVVAHETVEMTGEPLVLLSFAFFAFLYLRNFGARGRRVV